MAKTEQRKQANRGYDAKRRTAAWRKLYRDVRWTKGRKLHLAQFPLCVMCAGRGQIKAATVVDHKVPHRGDETLFFSASNWQSLCKQDHDQAKQREEVRGFVAGVDDDGWPSDPNHPANVDARAQGAVYAGVSGVGGGCPSLGPSDVGPAATMNAELVFKTRAGR